MTPPTPQHSGQSDLVLCVLLAVTAATLSFLVAGQRGFNWQDESFLWYGVQRTALGELPLRDFRSYDPGRYFWCAAFLPVLGNGIVAVRAATAAFAALGLACGLLAARRTVANRWMLLPIALLLQAWMLPPWKQYESSLAMIGVLVATRYLERPTTRRLCVAGAFAGIAAFFGRNLGLYAACAMTCVALLVWWKNGRAQPWKHVAALVLGIVVGYSPMICLLFVPGFCEAFIDSVAFYARQGSLNAELPVPWPWRVQLAGKSFAAAGPALAIGCLFVLLVVWNITGLVTSITTRVTALADRAALVGATFVGLFWAHHASVRSDVFHLAQVAHPLWIGALALPAAFLERRRSAAQASMVAVLLLVSGLALWHLNPTLRRLRGDSPTALVEVDIAGDKVKLTPNEARSFEAIVALARHNVRPEEQLWVSAQFIGLYPILGRRAPCWDIYPAWTADDREQDRMLEELASVQWVLLDLRPIGGDEDMVLPNSHPRVWTMLQRDFDRQAVPGAPPSLVLLRRRKT